MRTLPLRDVNRVKQVFHRLRRQAAAHIDVLDGQQRSGYGRIVLDQHRKDVLAEVVRDGKLALAVIRRDRLRREQVNKTFAPIQAAKNLFPPFLPSIESVIVPDLVSIQSVRDLDAKWSVYTRIADK